MTSNQRTASTSDLAIDFPLPTRRQLGDTSLARNYGLHGALFSTAMAVLAMGCNREEPAPYCFHLDDDSCVIFPPGLELSLTCADLDEAVANANYSYTVATNLDTDRLQFSAENLPEGLSIDEDSGIISGKPTQEGTYSEIRITATTLDESLSTTAECEPLVVKERLTIDLSELPGGCLAIDQELNDFAQAGTGNDITCEMPASSNASLCPLGGGNGELPPGLTVAEDCTVSGTISDDARGSFAWIVHAKQDGATVSVPFCAANDVTMAHNVTLSVAGAEQASDTLPLKIFFDPQSAIDLETSSPLRFDVRAACLAGECDRVQVNFAATCSPLTDVSGNAVKPVSVLEEDGNNVGLTHPLNLATTALVEEKYRARPWITSIAFTYCTNANTAMKACDESAELRTSHFSLPIVAWPQEP